MECYLVLLISVAAFAANVNVPEKILCPKYCSCDLYENLNRADCSDKRLISPYIDIPNTVEILDLSYNDISSLEDRCFKDLDYLINLTLANNGIHTIFLDAFIDLINLQHIDLSYNRLEYFDPRIFENNRKLVGVNLDGNKFMSLADQPFIISTSIQYLSLHKAQIVETSDSLFVKMPLLEKLDLSDNLMITLNVATFMRMGQLKYLNVLSNHWTTCHSDLKSTVEYLRARKVEVRINVCNFKLPGKKFERMMMAPPADGENIETLKEKKISVAETDITSVWKNSTVLNGTTIECEVENLQKVCQLYEACNLTYNKLVAEQATKNFRLRIFDQNDRVYVALYSGLFLGVFVTSSIVYVIYLICGSRYWKKRRLLRKLAERRRQMPVCINTVRNPVVIPRELRPVRRQARPQQPQPTRHAINRANQRDFLLARLFERPERHRQIHHGVSSRAQNVQRSQDRERLIRESPPTESLSPLDAAMQEISAMQNELDQFIEQSQTSTVATTPDIVIVAADEPPRAETPPPAYNEIIKN